MRDFSCNNVERILSGVDRERGVGARLDGGAIIDEITVEGERSVTVRYERCPAGWQATFELTHPEVDDLSVKHRLVSDTLAQAKASVPDAILYLTGTPVDGPY
jgi:hypothetical protein